jgi:hypothetical protein
VSSRTFKPAPEVKPAKRARKAAAPKQRKAAAPAVVHTLPASFQAASVRGIFPLAPVAHPASPYGDEIPF